MKNRLIVNNIYRFTYALDDEKPSPGTEREIRRLVGRLKKLDRTQAVFKPVFFLSIKNPSKNIVVKRSNIISFESLESSVRPPKTWSD